MATIQNNYKNEEAEKKQGASMQDWVFWISALGSVQSWEKKQSGVLGWERD